MASLNRLPNVSKVTQVRKEKELLFSFKNQTGMNVRVFFRDVPTNGGVIDIWAMLIVNTMNNGEVPIIHFSKRTNKNLLENFGKKYPMLVRYTLQGKDATKKLTAYLRTCN